MWATITYWAHYGRQLSSQGLASGWVRGQGGSEDADQLLSPIFRLIASAATYAFRVACTTKTERADGGRI